MRSGAAARARANNAAAAPTCVASNAYFDRVHDIHAVKLLPGEYYVADRDVLLVTVLGSCVAACLRDPLARVGGMNHFMLPDCEAAEPVGMAARYGTFAMEMLINDLLKRGGRRDRLEAKVFGGGNVIPGMAQANIGNRNAEFVLRFLHTEGIPLAASDLGADCPRKVYFFPATGRALVKRLRAVANDTLVQRETAYRSRLVQAPGGGEVDLFA